MSVLAKPEASKSPTRIATPVPRDIALERSLAIVRGDVIFEGELLPTAYELNGHVQTVDGRGRVILPPPTVVVAGIERPWTSFKATEQFAYLSAYGAGLDAIARHGLDNPGPRLRHPEFSTFTETENALHAAGFERALTVSAFAAEARGHTVDGEIIVADPIATTGIDCLARVHEVGPATYQGTLTADEVVISAYGHEVTRLAGAKILFPPDAYLRRAA